MSAAAWGWLTLAFPLGGMLVIALGWRMLPGRLAGYLGSAAVLLSFAASIGMLLALLALPEEERAVNSGLFPYVSAVGIDVDLGILVDPLSVFMCLVVTGVSFLIHVYSVGYMASDAGYRRFFAYLNYFVFSMLLLVLADNFVLLIIGWAFVGAASYLLISYWYRRRTATEAGIKAFVINVIGDVALVIAAFLLFQATGVLEYAAVFEGARNSFVENDGPLVAACLLLLVGAFAKSGQLPLHTWLPDAMEGPTPVSALIHAATMVTAGVYLIARMHPLFELAPAAAAVGAIVGTLTLLFAATVALVQTDFKRIIAYSTVSQIGFMVLGVTSAAYAAGLFHLMTHAFFKALLFMAAGSVIGALGLTNTSIDRLSGFRRAMPFTFAAFMAGALSLAGFPLFAGYFSKDEILAFAIERGGLYAVLGIVGMVVALLTAIYAFRMVFRVFWGDPVPAAEYVERHHEPAYGGHVNPNTGEREDTEVGFPGAEHHIAEGSAWMKFGMAPLIVLSVIGGFVGIPGVTDTVEHFLAPTFADSRYADVHPSTGAEYVGLAIGAVLALAGIAVAFVIWVRRRGVSLEVVTRAGALHRFLERKWYFDELYDAVFVRPARAFGAFGRSAIERAFVQDTLIGGASGLVRAGTALARAVQTGALRTYALLLLAGGTALVLYFLVVSG